MKLQDIYPIYNCGKFQHDCTIFFL